jgi:chromosome segregation ATPase
MSSEQTKASYVAETRAKLEEWSAAIDELEARARQKKAEAKQQFEQRIAELKQKREEARQRLKELETAPEDAWESFKEGFERLWDFAKRTVTDSTQAFKEGLQDKS